MYSKANYYKVSPLMEGTCCSKSDAHKTLLFPLFCSVTASGSLKSFLSAIVCIW